MADPIPPTVAWVDGRVRLIDQRELPGRLRFLDCATVDELCAAISTMAIRGAPALGAAGSYGVALATQRRGGVAGVLAAARQAAERLVATRPTAVNLAWGVGRVLAAAEAAAEQGPAAVRRAAREEADRVAAEDLETNQAIGRHGVTLVPAGAQVLTHCNTGSLACVGYGTALGVIRAAAEAGKAPRVWVDETRPLLQGSRLTAWELDRLGIPHAVIADSAAASLMAAGEVDCVVTGADRIAANGDTANKIGTYGLAVLAAHHGIPLYVVAPSSTVDLETETGAGIPIEERAGTEISARFRSRNPAFDVTPADLIAAIVTEDGVHRRPFSDSLARGASLAQS
jgi:methylthioribose-1-phosphate isomerase